MITASHNPPEYNGIKPTANDGVEISREDELKIEDIYYSKKFSKVDSHGRNFNIETIMDSYIEAVLSLINVEKYPAKKVYSCYGPRKWCPSTCSSNLVK